MDERLAADNSEVDLRALVAEEAAIEDALQSGNLRSSDAQSLLAEYARLLKEPPSTKRTNVEAFLNELHAFGTQASLQARRGSHTRWVVVFTTPDQTGVMSAIAERVGRLNCNIEGATLAVVAGQATTAVVVSAPAVLSGETVAMQTEEVTRALSGVPRMMLSKAPLPQPEVVEMEARDTEWPKPGSALWHMTIRSPDRPRTLLAITDSIAKRNIPLLTFSSWLEHEDHRRESIVDLNLAIQPELVADKSCAEIREEVRRAVQQADVLYAPVPWPTRLLALADAKVTPTQHEVCAVTVVGPAQPGFVHSVLRGVANAPHGSRPELTILGSHMAILESYSILTLVIDPVLSDSTVRSAPDWRNQLRQSISSCISPPFDGQIFGPYPVFPQDYPAPPTTPTHVLTIETPEQPGVLGRVTALLEDCKANIVWLVSYVFDPRVGAPGAVCSIELQICLDDGSPANLVRLDQGLASLRRFQGWKVALRPWTVKVMDDVSPWAPVSLRAVESAEASLAPPVRRRIRRRRQ